MTTGPGKSQRQGLSLLAAVAKFDTEAKAEAWFIEQRWPDGIRCPFCGTDSIYHTKNRKPMPYQCRGCRKSFRPRPARSCNARNCH